MQKVIWVPIAIECDGKWCADYPYTKCQRLKRATRGGEVQRCSLFNEKLETEEVEEFSGKYVKSIRCNECLKYERRTSKGVEEE